MPIFQSEEWVYNPTASLTVLGKKVPVSAFILHLTANGVPKIVITIDPFHDEGQSGLEAMAPGVDSFVDRWRQLQDAIRDRTQREIDFTFDARGAKDKLQTFELKDWIMVAAGFSDIHARGGFALTIEAVHPLYAFEESTPHLMGNGVQTEIPFDEVVGDNVYEALLAAMQAYRDRFEEAMLMKEPAEDPDYATDPESIIDEYDKMMTKLKENLEWDSTWDGSGFPDKPFQSGLVDMIPYGVVEYVKALSNAGSWDWLIRTFCAQWFLSVIPTFYDTTLKLRPIEPWQPYKMTIYDTDIEQLQLPSVDPTPIKGVMGMFDGLGATGSIEWAVMADGESQSKQEEVSHKENLQGSILTLAVPGWMRDLTINRQAQNSDQTAPQGENLDTEITWEVPNNAADAQQGTTGTVEPEEMRDLYDAMKVMAKELFLENYRLHYQLATIGRLLIKSEQSELEGKWILPGYVMRLQANPDLPGSKGRALLDFYVTQVVHSVDCFNRTASTQIGGGYIHDVDKPDLKAIQAGVAVNVMYKDDPGGGGDEGGGAPGGEGGGGGGGQPTGPGGVEESGNEGGGAPPTVDPTPPPVPAGPDVDPGGEMG